MGEHKFDNILDDNDFNYVVSQIDKDNGFTPEDFTEPNEEKTKDTIQEWLQEYIDDDERCNTPLGYKYPPMTSLYTETISNIYNALARKLEDR